MQSYMGWRQVPEGYKARGQWELANRRVVRGEKPVAAVEIYEWRRIGGGLTIHEDGTEEHRPACLGPAPRHVHLFAEHQTRPFTPSDLELAYRRYFETFVRPLRRDLYIWESEGWKWCHGHLCRRRVRDHVTGLEVYGVLGSQDGEFPETRFAAIDLDLHGGDRGVFLDQLRVLLGQFHGKEGWHLQVRDEHAGGVHLIQVVHPTVLRLYCGRLHERLRKLDREHPHLADRARRSGMKSLGDLEVYPDMQHGFRLPLCRGRTMLLDQPLPLVQNRKGRLVQDVVKYMRWIDDHGRRYMAPGDVHEYIAARLSPPTASPLAMTESPRPQVRQGVPAEGAVNAASLAVPRTASSDWVSFVAQIAENGLKTHDSLGQVVYELAKWFIYVEYVHLDHDQRVERTTDLLTCFAFERANGFVSRLASGREQDVASQVVRVVNSAAGLQERFAERLRRIRRAQDEGKYRTVLRLEPLIRREAGRESMFSNTPPHPQRTIPSLSLQVLAERGGLDEELPTGILQAIAEKKGRQQIDLFARRFLNALHASPGGKRFVSLVDMYQMMDPQFRRDGKAHPTTAQEYLRTLRDRAGLIRPERRYRKGERPNEYALSDEAVNWFSLRRSRASAPKVGVA